MYAQQGLRQKRSANMLAQSILYSLEYARVPAEADLIETRYAVRSKPSVERTFQLALDRHKAAQAFAKLAVHISVAMFSSKCLQSSKLGIERRVVEIPGDTKLLQTVDLRVGEVSGGVKDALP